METCRSIIIYRYLLLLFCCINGAIAIDQRYMENECGRSINDVKSILLDTSLSLTYSNDQDCTTTVSVPSGERIFLQIRRFFTEEAESQCFDYFSIYDGASRLANPLLLQQCGQLNGEPIFNTTSNVVTLHFISDSSAKDRGFSLFILAFTTGTCREDQLLCDSRNICMDETNSWCDGFRHCPNGIDENSCQGSGSESSQEVYLIGLAVGLTFLGVIVIIIAGVLGHYLYKKYKWNQFLRHLHSKESIIDIKMRQIAQVKQQATQPSYPITYHYQSDEYINKRRMEKEAQIREAQILPSQSDTSLQLTTDKGLPGKETLNNESTQPLSQSTPRSEPEIRDNTDMERPVSGADDNEINYPDQAFNFNEKVTEL